MELAVSRSACSLTSVIAIFSHPAATNAFAVAAPIPVHQAQHSGYRSRSTERPTCTTGSGDERHARKQSVITMPGHFNVQQSLPLSATRSLTSPVSLLESRRHRVGSGGPSARALESLVSRPSYVDGGH